MNRHPIIFSILLGVGLLLILSDKLGMDIPPFLVILTVCMSALIFIVAVWYDLSQNKERNLYFSKDDQKRLDELYHNKEITRLQKGKGEQT